MLVQLIVREEQPKEEEQDQENKERQRENSFLAQFSVDNKNEEKSCFFSAKTVRKVF